MPIDTGGKIPRRPCKPAGIVIQYRYRGKVGHAVELQDKMRLVQELVPGKQITLCHLIANPDEILYRKLGLDPAVDYSRAAIGIVTLSPAETAIIAGDIDRQEALGIYEVAPEDFAIAEFVDSSKLELQRIVRQGLDILRKENA